MEKNWNLKCKKIDEYVWKCIEQRLHKGSPPEWSGAGERDGVEGPGERLCVGEPERLSLDDC